MSGSFKLRGGLLYLPKELRLTVLAARHDRLTAGHSGIHRTAELVQHDDLWPGWRQAVTDFASYIAAV
nr:hypothetical protein HK105_006795 [Polyrhizophydium stewartii]